MKLVMTLGLVLMSFTGTLLASQVETISGPEAYELYLKLPGKTCQEYRLNNYVVFSKYQTKSCNESQTDSSKWSCTTQLELKNGKISKVLSADCFREI